MGFLAIEVLHTLHDMINIRKALLQGMVMATDLGSFKRELDTFIAGRLIQQLLAMIVQWNL